MPENADDCTVQIIGAGPGGLFAACKLLRHGVKAARRRAKARTASRDSRHRSPAGGTGDAGARRLEIAFPARASVHIRRLQLLGPGSQEIVSETFAEVEFGTEVTAIEDDVDGVRVTLATGGRTETITAAYLVGAGDGHSITRHSMHEHLTGETYYGQYLVADAKVHLPCPPACGCLIVGPTGFVLPSP